METVKLDGEDKNDSKSAEKTESSEKPFPWTWDWRGSWREWRKIRTWQDFRDRVNQMSRHEQVVGT